MEKPILKSFLRIFEGPEICEAVLLGVSNANFQLEGKNIISGKLDTQEDKIIAVDFIDLEVSPFECDGSLAMFDNAWALVYIQRFDRKKYPKSTKKPFNKAKLEGFAISHGQIVYVETYQILMLHLEIMANFLTQYRSMQNTIVGLLYDPQSPLLRQDMSREQIVASTATWLSSALRVPR